MRIIFQTVESIEFHGLYFEKNDYETFMNSIDFYRLLV